MAKVAAALLRSDVADCLRLLREAREAARTRQWARAIDRGEEARTRLADLNRHEALAPEERTALATAVDDLGLIVRYLEGLARPGARRTELSHTKRGQLDAIIALVSAISGRLRIPLSEF